MSNLPVPLNNFSLTVSNTDNYELVEYLGKRPTPENPVILQGEKAFSLIDKLSKLHNYDNNVIDVEYEIVDDPQLTHKKAFSIQLEEIKDKNALVIFKENIFLKAYEKIKDSIKNAYDYLNNKFSNFFNRLCKDIEKEPLADLHLIVKNQDGAKLELQAVPTLQLENKLSQPILQLEKLKKADINEPLMLEFKQNEKNLLPVAIKLDEIKNKSSYEIIKDCLPIALNLKKNKDEIVNIENQLIDYKIEELVIKDEKARDVNRNFGEKILIEEIQEEKTHKKNQNNELKDDEKKNDNGFGKEFVPVDIWGMNKFKHQENSQNKGTEKIELEAQEQSSQNQAQKYGEKIELEEEKKEKYFNDKQNSAKTIENLKKEFQEKNLNLLTTTEPKLDKTESGEKFISFKAIDDSVSPPKVYKVKYFSDDSKLASMQESLKDIGTPIKVNGLISEKLSNIMYAKSIEIDREKHKQIIESTKQEKTQEQNKFIAPKSKSDRER